jgi:hypothetical protein
MLTGALPFEATTVFQLVHRIITEPTPDPRAKRPQVSERAARVCMKLMARDRAQRYASAAELLEDLKGSGMPTASGPVAVPARPWTGDQKLIAGTVAAAAVVVLAVLVWAIATGGSGDGGPRGASTGGSPGRPAGPLPGPAPSTNETASKSSTPPPAGLADGLMLALSFDEADAITWGSGKTVLKDISGRGNHGAGPHRMGLARGKGVVEHALSFDGTSQAVEFPALDERAVAMWVMLKPDDPMRGAVLYDGGRNGAGAEGRARLIGTFRPGGFNPRLKLESAGVFAGFWYSDALVPFDPLPDGKWHHVVVTWEGAQVRIMIDGILHRGKAGTYDSLRDSDQPLTLPTAPKDDGGMTTLLGRIRDEGRGFVDATFFKGMLDEVAVWNRPLSEAEMRALYEFAGRGESYCRVLAGGR